MRRSDPADSPATAEEAAALYAAKIESGIVTAEELRTLDLPRQEPLLGDWFCQGDQGFIFAARGVGKTWFALQMAIAISTGGKMGPWLAPSPARVLYIDGEMTPRLMRSRERGMGPAGNENLLILNHAILFDRTELTMNITSPALQLAIREHCVQMGVRLLVLDNLSTLASGMKENDADEWEKVNYWLLDMRRRGIAVVIVHHAGRNGEMRGTSKREDAAFWVISLRDERQQADDNRGARFVSNFTKPSRNTQEQIPPLEWHYQTDNDTGAVRTTTRELSDESRILFLIERGVTANSEIAEELKLSPAKVTRTAKKLAAAGKIKVQGRKYLPIENRAAPPSASVEPVESDE